MKRVGAHNHAAPERRGDADDFRLACLDLASSCRAPNAWDDLREDRELLARWAEEIGLPGSDSFAPASLFRARLSFDWGHALEAIDDAAFLSVVTVQGAERVDRARAAGKGIVFATMAGLFTETLPRWLTLHSGADQLIVGLHAGQTGGWFTPERPMSLAGELKLAQTMLRNGGHVHIMVDGYHGARGTDFEFLGRIRAFQPTFAELAARTGALIVPVMTDVTPDGTVRISLLPELASLIARRDSEGGTSAEWIAAIVGQAANFVAYGWQTRPEAVKWGHMWRFLALPRAEAAA
jgi:lauroyl/myristoyl acyltransferase